MYQSLYVFYKVGEMGEPYDIKVQRFSEPGVEHRTSSRMRQEGYRALRPSEEVWHLIRVSGAEEIK